MAKHSDSRYDDGMEVVIPSDMEVVHYPTPTSDLEALPPSGLEVARPQEQIKQELQPGQHIPVAVGSGATKKRWTRTRILILVVIFLVCAVIALGAGLGISSKNKEQSQSAVVPSASASGGSTQPVGTTTLSSGYTSASSFSGGVVSPTGQATAAAAKDADLNDQLTINHVTSWFYTSQTADQVGQLCRQNNARLTQVRVDNSSVPTFTVLMIENTGVYQSDWWWWYGANSTSKGNNTRLISIDPYLDATGTVQFAVVQVPETGRQNKAWWWYFGITTNAIEGYLANFNARLVALRGYLLQGKLVFVVIMAENVDDDYTESQYLTGASIDDISAKVDTGMRLISLSPNPLEGWDTILVKGAEDTWAWWYGLDYQTMSSTTSKSNTRMIDVSVYSNGGEKVFASVETDNSQ